MLHRLVIVLALLCVNFAQAEHRVYSDFDYLVFLDLQATAPLENCGPLVVRETIHYGAILVQLHRNANKEVVDFEIRGRTASFLPLTHTELTPFIENYIGVSRAEYDRYPKRDFMEMHADVDRWVRDMPANGQSFALVVHGDWFLNSLYVAEYLLRNIPQDAYPEYLKKWISFKSAMFPLTGGKDDDLPMLAQNFLGDNRLRPDHRLSNDSSNMISILNRLVEQSTAGTLPASINLGYNGREIRNIWQFRADLTPDAGKVYHYAYCQAKGCTLPWPLEIKKSGYWYLPATKGLDGAYTTESATELHLHGDLYREVVDKYLASKDYTEKVGLTKNPVVTEADVLRFAMYRLNVFIPRVKYFNQLKRQRFRVRIAADRTITPYSPHGNPVVDGVSARDMPMFVLDRGDHGFYVAKKNRNLHGEEKTALHHSSLLAGSDVVAAGRMRIKDGKLDALLFVSGHYKTGLEVGCDALKELQRVGVNIAEIELWFKDQNEPDDMKVPFINGLVFFEKNQCAKYEGAVAVTLADYNMAPTVHTTRTRAALESVEKRIKGGAKERVFLFTDYEATIGRLNEPGNKLREIAEVPMLAVRERDLLDTDAGRIEPLVHRYVKPRIRPLVSEDFTTLTGITQTLLDIKGKDMQHVFQEIQFKVSALERQGYEVVPVTYGDWDNAQVVPGQWMLLQNKDKWFPEHFRKWMNVKALVAQLGGDFAERKARYFADNPGDRGRAKGEVGQETAIKLAGLRLIGRPHSGVDDARNLLQLTQFWIRETAECLPQKPNGRPYDFKGHGIFDFCYDAQNEEWRLK